LVIAIRNIKSQVDERINSANKPGVSRAGKALKQSISAVEGELYQVKNRSNQDPLNHPIKLNNKIASPMGGFNRLLQQSGLPQITRPPIKMWRVRACSGSR
jgi:hypothetical protein